MALHSVSGGWSCCQWFLMDVKVEKKHSNLEEIIQAREESTIVVMQTIYVKQMQPCWNNTVCASDKNIVIFLWVTENHTNIEMILFCTGGWENTVLWAKSFLVPAFSLCQTKADTWAAAGEEPGLGHLGMWAGWIK